MQFPFSLFFARLGDLIHIYNARAARVLSQKNTAKAIGSLPRATRRPLRRKSHQPKEERNMFQQRLVFTTEKQNLKNRLSRQRYERAPHLNPSPLCAQADRIFDALVDDCESMFSSGSRTESVPLAPARSLLFARTRTGAPSSSRFDKMR